MWTLITQIGSSSMSLYGNIQSYKETKSIKDNLEEMKTYLKHLNDEIQQIKSQNREILNRLDKLPEEIHHIVKTVVTEDSLNDKYNTIENTKKNFFLLHLEINAIYWINYSEALTYLFSNEHRLSKIFDLIEACELALIITKWRAVDFVKHDIRKRVASTNELYQTVLESLKSQLELLSSQLNNKDYIAQHNFQRNIQKLEDITFSHAPNRDKTETYQERHVTLRQGEGPRGTSRDREIITYETKTRVVPDHAFNERRNRHVAEVKAHISQAKETVAKAKLIKSQLIIWANYLEFIEHNSTQNIVPSISNTTNLFDIQFEE